MTVLWDWALATYERAGVEQALLDLQDVNEQNVCLLLWAAWAATTGRPLDDDAFEEAADIARAWEGNAVLPLRTLRRSLKKPIPDLDPTAREAVRAEIKAVELAAEHALLKALERIEAGPRARSLALDAALIAAARVWGGATPRAQLQGLAALLSNGA
jgi:uncharacterized protein (TIGR02444 family)